MTTALTADEARRARHSAQLLGGSDLSPAAVVDRAVALQGQDLPAVLRAIALRSAPGTTVDDVRAAFDAGSLVRSWSMRGTLFATTPARLRALLGHTAGRTHRAAARRRGALGLDDATIARAGDIAADALAERPLPRAALLALWDAGGLPVRDGRGYHLLMHLAVDGLLHWGPFDGAEQLLTLTPLGEPPPRTRSRRSCAATSGLAVPSRPTTPRGGSSCRRRRCGRRRASWTTSSRSPSTGARRGSSGIPSRPIPPA